MSRPSRSAVITAFTAVYIIWGSTYLAIKYAIGSIPPFLMAGSRFLLAGALLYGFARWRGALRPNRAEWRHAAIVGGCLVLCGNGGVTYGELYVPSGLTSLLIALVPVFMALMGWWSGITARPTGLVWLGLATGFAGVVFLLRPDPAVAARPHFALGVAVVLVSALIWSGGSLYSRRLVSRTTPFATSGMQMLCGGALQVLASLILGEWHGFNPAAVSGASITAFFYLVFIGAIVGFTAYSWLLQHCPPAQVATYAYVNPVVAVFLAATPLGGEKITFQIISGATLIVAAVAMVIAQQSRTPAAVAAPLQKAESPPMTTGV